MDWLREKYHNYSNITINHIIVHAVLKKIYLKHFNEAVLKRDIEFSRKKPDYKKAWDIVEEIGSDTIIEEFISHYEK